MTRADTPRRSHFWPVICDPHARARARLARRTAARSARAVAPSFRRTREGIMLGEKIGEFTGKSTSQRVLPTRNGLPAMEVTEEGTGHLLGIEGREVATYQSVTQPSGYT